MATVKINCPKCVGTGLTGDVVETTCSQCTGTGTISVSDASTLASLNTASTTPIVVTAPTQVAKVAVKSMSKGK